MLTGLKIGNFKAFGETQHIPIRPLTLIFGANSSGKSSVIQGLLLLNHLVQGGAADARQVWRGEQLVDLGGFDNFVHGHDRSRVVNLAVDYGDNPTLSLQEWEVLSDQDAPLRLHVSLGFDRRGGADGQTAGSPIIKRIRLSSDDAYPGSALREVQSPAPPAPRTPEGITREVLFGLLDQSSSVDPHFWRFLSEQEAVREIDDGLVRNATFLRLVFEGPLPGLVYLGPLRSYPTRGLSVLRSVDPNYSSSGAWAWDLARLDEPVRSETNRTLKRLGLGYQLELREWRTAPPHEECRLELVLTDDRGLQLEQKDIGSGISQALPVIVQAASGRQSCVAVEQPELHLHPALQAELGDVLIESALGERKNTFLLETHSEHLILRIMRRMRETQQGRLPDGMPPVRPEHVSVLYAEPGPRGSIVREMPLNARGELVKSWPGGFFEEGFRELFG